MRFIVSTEQFQSLYWRIHSRIPLSLRTVFDLLTIQRNLDQKQIDKLEKLGEGIGLDKKEITASYKAPLNMTNWRSRLTPLSALIMIVVIICIGFLIFFFSFGRYSMYEPPGTTYTPGTRYGTLRPCEFHSSD